jgi:hypothetical protein
MAPLPRYKGFVMEDFAEATEKSPWLPKLITPLNEFMSSVSNAVTGRLTRKDNLLGYSEPFEFTTAASAAATFPLRFKNKLLGGVKPTSITVGLIDKQAGGAMANAWSLQARVAQDGQIEVYFQGLENSTKYVGTLNIDG